MSEFESTDVNKMNNIVSLSFTFQLQEKKNSFYNLKTSLLSVRAALDHHLKSPPHDKIFSSVTTVYLFSEANK